MPARERNGGWQADVKLRQQPLQPRIMSGRRDQHDEHPPMRTEPTLGDFDRLDAPRAPSMDGLPQVSVEPRRSHARATGSRRHKHRRGR